MAKKANYSPCKILTRIWVVENTKEVYESSIMVDLEDIEQVEQYLDIENDFNHIKTGLTTMRSYTGMVIVVMGDFELICGIVKEAKIHQKRNKTAFFN